MASPDSNQLASVVERVNVERAERFDGGAPLSGQVRTFGSMDLFQFQVVNVSATGLLIHCPRARVIPLAKDTLIEMQISQEELPRPFYILGKVVRRDESRRLLAIRILPQSAAQRDAWHDLVLDWSPPSAQVDLPSA
jgi:PilZ domain